MNTEHRQRLKHYFELMKVMESPSIAFKLTGEILFANDAFSVHFNKEKDDILYKDINSIIQDNEHLKSLEGIIDKIKLTNTVPDYTTHHNGGHLNIPSYIKILLLEDEPEHAIIATFTTNSFNKSNEQLSSRNTSKINYVNKLISTAGHELRSPLNAILGFVGTLLMRLPGPLNNDQVEQLNIVKGSAERLLTIINELEEFTKIELGNVDIKSETIDCSHIIDEITKILTPVADKKGVRLITNSNTQSSLIKTDPTLLSQIMKKIIHNGIQYATQGEIKISYENKFIDDSNYLIIHVTDSGEGIAPDDQAKLFKPFERLFKNGSYSDGMGLGLHTSAKLASLINARIEYKNERDSGSRFSIYLPNQSID